MAEPNANDSTRVIVTGYSQNLEHVGDEVRVVVVPLDSPPAPFAELFDCLTDEEQQRATRYKVEKARQQFVTGRGLLRRMLADSLGIADRAVPISYGATGKPVLTDPDAALHFNISHTDGLVLIALARRELGIDVERVRTVENPDGLVGRFFSAAEHDVYLTLEAELRTTGFFRGWTSKEAIIKAAGLSVAYLDEFDVELHPARPAALLAARHPRLRVERWALAGWEVAPGFAAAIAIEGADQLRLTSDV